MNLYIVRHADALPVGGGVARDADRPLSKQGERDAAAVGRALATLEPGTPLIVTSPLVRAQRTGDLFRKAFPRQTALETWEELAPGNPSPGCCESGAQPDGTRGDSCRPSAGSDQPDLLPGG